MMEPYSAEQCVPEGDELEVMVYGKETESDENTDWHIGYYSMRNGWMISNNGDYIDGGYGRDYPAKVTHWKYKPEPPK